MACLIGYGASAVNPYVMFESLYTLHREGRLARGDGPRGGGGSGPSRRSARACSRSSRRWGSRRSARTPARRSSRPSGSSRRSSTSYFTGTPSRVGGVGLNVLAWECLDRHRRAYPAASSELLPAGGVYAWRREGEYHGWNPETIATLQQAARREGGPDAYERFATYVNEVAVPQLVAARAAALPRDRRRRSRSTRSSRRSRSSGASSRAGCRSGALSPEAHETLAAGMNRLGGKSNTGEGGEDPERFKDERRSSIKQVASGRFGVTVQLPRQRRRAPDQGRPGRQARRGRPAAGAQGRPLHRAPAPLDPGRRPDLAAAAPRHLLDRGPEAADLRPALREPACPHLGEARVRGGGGDRRGRCGEGERRSRGDRGPRRRNGRLAAGVDPPRRACPGRSGSPRPSRRCCATTCARASSSRSTARCAPAATS